MHLFGGSGTTCRTPARYWISALARALICRWEKPQGPCEGIVIVEDMGRPVQLDHSSCAHGRVLRMLHVLAMYGVSYRAGQYEHGKGLTYFLKPGVQRALGSGAVR